MVLGNKQGCGAAVEVHLSGMVVKQVGWGRGACTAPDRMQLKGESDRLKRQIHIAGLLLLKHF